MEDKQPQPERCEVFNIIGPDFETMTVRGWAEAVKIARETAGFIGWASVFDDNGENVLVLRRCPG